MGCAQGGSIPKGHTKVVEALSARLDTKKLRASAIKALCSVSLRGCEQLVSALLDDFRVAMQNFDSTTGTAILEMLLGVAAKDDLRVIESIKGVLVAPEGNTCQ